MPHFAKTLPAALLPLLPPAVVLLLQLLPAGLLLLLLHQTSYSHCQCSPIPHLLTQILHHAVPCRALP
jgi:hypothetical protein